MELALGASSPTGYRPSFKLPTSPKSTGCGPVARAWVRAFRASPPSKDHRLLQRANRTFNPQTRRDDRNPFRLPAAPLAMDKALGLLGRPLCATNLKFLA